MAQVSGIVKITVDGTLHRSLEGAVLDMGGKEREAVVGYAVYGFKEKVMPATLTFTLAHLAGLNLTDLAAVTDAVLRYECDNGITYVVSNAFVSKPLKINGSDGTVEVEMVGDAAEEETLT